MTYTYDFAYNCATVDEHLVAPCSPEIPSISQQVQQFRTSFMTKRDVFGPGHFGGQNTVTAIWIGINDAHRSWEKPNAKGIMDAVIDRYFQLVQDLVNAGLKNIVLLGIPGTFSLQGDGVLFLFALPLFFVTSFRKANVSKQSNALRKSSASQHHHKPSSSAPTMNLM